MNGYTDEQIKSYFESDDSEFNYDINGIEFKEIGEPQKFTSEDGYITTTVTPMSIKIDVAKANINTSIEEDITTNSTTIEDIVADLESDNDFRVYEYDGQVIYENGIYNDDDSIIISHTYYNYQYYNISFPCEDDIITYNVEEIEDYDEAETVSSHYFFAGYIIQSALELNGYTNEQIQSFTQSEENGFDYDINGIEFKEIGQMQEFTSEDGLSKINVVPMSIKIDLARANFNTSKEEVIEYKVLDGAYQKFDITKDSQLTFRFNIDYDTFVKEGEIYIDDKEVSKDNYTVSKGSTIIIFSNEYTNTLSNGNHTILATVLDGKAQTKFTINNAKTSANNNPKTADNIIIYITMLGLSIIGLVGTVIYTKKTKFN